MRTRLLPLLPSLIVIGTLLVATPTAAIDGTEPATTVAGPEQIGSAYGLAVDDEGNLFVADSSNHRVQKIAPDGTTETVAGGNGPGSEANQLALPWGIALDDDGSLFVADSGNNRVQKVAPDGTTTTVAGGNGYGSGADQLRYPLAIAVDSDGNLYVADHENHRVQKVAPDGTTTTVAGGNGSGSGTNQLFYPLGVAVDRDGNLYVADRANHRIQKVEPDGAVSTVAGGNGYGTAGNQLHDPRGVALDDDANLYVTDVGNQRVQKIAIDAAVTTVAGTGNGSQTFEVNALGDLAIDIHGSLYVGGNTANSDSIVQKIASPDATTPTITITNPAEGTSIEPGTALTAEFSCADAGTSFLASCTATLDGTPITSGDTVDTAATGTRTLVVTASDWAGNTTTLSRVATIAVTPPPTPPAPPPTPPAPRRFSGTIADAASLTDLVDASDYQTTDATTLRLYRAFFDRDPDIDGVRYWIGRSRTGADPDDLAWGFAQSTEFRTSYGPLTNDEFLTLLYDNILGRTPDALGFAYWLDQMNNGLGQHGVVRWIVANDEFETRYPYAPTS